LEERRQDAPVSASIGYPLGGRGCGIQPRATGGAGGDGLPPV